MKPNTERAAWILGAAAAAAAVVTGVVLATRSSSPATPGAPAMTTLTTGHWYTVVFSCPSVGAAPKIANITGVNLVSATPSANGGTIVFDYGGTSGSYALDSGGCAITVTDNGLSPGPVAVKNPNPPAQSQPALQATGPYTKLSSAVLQPGETYLLEVPPQAGETLATYGQYMAKVAPATLKVSQQFDVGVTPSGWPSTSANVWRYVIVYGGGAANKNTIKQMPWTIAPAPSGLAVWTTGGATS